MKNRKFLAVILAVAVLLTFAFVLSACGDDKPEEKPTETTTEAVNDEPEVQTELNVSFDENATYAMDDVAIADAVSAEIVENGVSRKVQFTIKSSELTDDGQYIKVVVAAEGIEKEILLPYEAEPEVYIREDLKPLYDLLSKAGEKSIAVTFSADSLEATGAATASCAFNAIVNLTENGFEFALTDAAKADGKAEVLYKDGVLTVCGFAIDALSNYAEAATEFIPTDFDFAEIFGALSAALDSVDSAIDKIAMLNIGIRKDGANYYVNTDTAKLLPILQILLNSTDVDINVSEYIDLLDEQLDGALKSGDIKINVSLSIKDNGIVAGFRFGNDKTGGQVAATCAVTVADAVAELPAPVEPDLKDIEITVPLALPQKNKEITLKAIVRLTDILTVSGGDYATASLAVNGSENAAKAVLNDKYIYVDMSGLAGGQTMTFYQAFEIDGEPVSIFRYLTEILFARGENDISEDYDLDETDGGNDLEIDYNDPTYSEDNGDDNDENYTGYGIYDIDEAGKVILPIGATEDDLRSKLCVYVCDENDEQIEVTDYQIIGFDGSAPFSNDIEIIFYDFGASYELVIRDPDAERYDGLYVYPFIVALGTNAADAQNDIYASVFMTDGNVSWELYNNAGFTINKVDGVDVTGEYVFAEKGNYTLTVTYDANGEQTEAAVYVYDPENLEVQYVEFPTDIYVYAGATAEQIRDDIHIRVDYDNGDFEYVEDFELVGFEPGDTVVEVQWRGYSAQIGIEYYGDVNPYYPDDEPAGGFDIMTLMQYFRRTDILESEDVFAEIKGIFEQNKPLFESAFVVDRENKSLRIVVNSKEGGDLLDIVNLFFGIPTEDGFEDIDEGKIISMFNSGESTIDMNYMFKMLIGVEFDDFIADLCIDAGISTENGFAVKFELNDGANVKYLVTGIGVNTVERSESGIAPTEADIAAARSFDIFPMMLAMFLMGALMG